MRSQLVLGALTIAATLAGSGTAFAQECTTREQVQAELRQALRDETILSGDSSGAIALERAARHPAPPTVADPALERQMKAELADAVREETILSGDSSGAMALERAARHPAPPTVADAARQRQIKVELADALRNETILSGDSSGAIALEHAARHPAPPTVAVAARTSCPPATRTAAGRTADRTQTQRP
jgi:hypothetical protein